MKWFHAVVPLLWVSGVASAAETDASTFPIWGEEARARGYAIPLPFGINLSYMNMRQNIDVDSISFSGLALGNHPIPVDMFNIDAGHTREQSKTENLRLDMWVFPFLNIYGLVGHTRGSSVSNVSVDADPSRYTGVDRIIASSVHQLIRAVSYRILILFSILKAQPGEPVLLWQEDTKTGLPWWIPTLTI